MNIVYFVDNEEYIPQVTNVNNSRQIGAEIDKKLKRNETYLKLKYDETKFT